MHGALRSPMARGMKKEENTEFIRGDQSVTASRRSGEPVPSLMHSGTAISWQRTEPIYATLQMFSMI